MKNLVILFFIFIVIVIAFLLIRTSLKEKEPFVGIPAFIRTGRKDQEFRDLCVEKHLQLYNDCLATSGGDPNLDCVAKVQPRIVACRYNEF